MKVPARADSDKQPADGPMKIAVFGASGGTGKHVVELALAAGHEVVAFVRDPAKLAMNHDNLSAVQGDIQNAPQVEAAVNGVDAVVSTLGPSRNVPDYQIERGTRNIVAAMKKKGVRRLIVTSGAGVRVPDDKPGVPDIIIQRLLILFSRHVYEDMRRTVQVVQNSDLDWTVVRFPMLTTEAAKGTLKSGYVGRGPGMRITRTDAARFLVEQLTSDRFLRAAPMISN